MFKGNKKRGHSLKLSWKTFNVFAFSNFIELPSTENIRQTGIECAYQTEIIWSRIRALT